jgi:hypothetical protein
MGEGHEGRGQGVRCASVEIIGHWGESYALPPRCQPRKPLYCL